MSKCPSCGAENDEGSKFCNECGTKLPQDKECPQCHTHWPLKTKFCGECGYNFNAGAGQAPGAAKIMGDKNVIAGDVTTNINTTNYINHDETKKTVSCCVCERTIVITKAHKCSECHQYVCEDHYDDDTRLCQNCSDKKEAAAESEYRKALDVILEDGIIDNSEFDQLEGLRKRLGMTSKRAMELQTIMKQERSAKLAQGKNTQELMAVEKAQCDRAAVELYENGDAKKALSLLQPIYKRHSLSEVVLSPYLTALLMADRVSEAEKIVSELPVDLLGAYLIKIDIALKNEDLSTAEFCIANAEKLWPNSTLLKCRRVALYYFTSKQMNDQVYLAQAMDILTSIDAPANKLEMSWVFMLQYLVSKELGDEVPEIAKEFCAEQGVYFALVSGVLLGIKMGDEEEKVSMEACDDAQPRLLKKLYERCKRNFAEEDMVNGDQSMNWGTFTAYPDTFLDEWIKYANLGHVPSMYRAAKFIHEAQAIGAVRDDKYTKQFNGSSNACAIDLYMRALSRGEKRAAYNLSRIYGELGEEDKVIKYMKLAAANDIARAYYDLGMWSLGEKISWRDNVSGEMHCKYAPKSWKKDVSLALAYFERGVDLGNCDCMLELGRMYKKGNGIPQNVPKAKKLLNDAAKSRYVEVSKVALLEVNSLPLTFAESKRLLADALNMDDNKEMVAIVKKCAEVGNTDAMNYLGVWLNAGKYGMGKDAVRAAKYFIKAAEAGNVSAMRNLAYCYKDGDGIAVDIGKAKYWFKQAINNGYRDADALRNELAAL